MMSSREMREKIIQFHYTHSMPSGASWLYSFSEAIVVFSIPPNANISTFLINEPNKVLELSRLWAPDGHERNLLTKAISFAVGRLRQDAPAYEALVSYADPNVGHAGYIYRAASWVDIGASEESRNYRGPAGEVVARRKFHSGGRHLNKAEILALGYAEHRMPGKLRFARGLTKKARARIAKLKYEGRNG